MSMSESVAAMAMDIKAMQFSQEYGLAIAKEVMDTTEQLQMNEVSELLPVMHNSGDIPAVPKGEFIDVYA